MKKFRVQRSIPVHLSITVEAEDADSAIEKATDAMSLDSYCGNGGTDKLVGTNDERVSLEPGEYPLESDGWSTTAEEIKE